MATPTRPVDGVSPQEVESAWRKTGLCGLWFERILHFCASFAQRTLATLYLHEHVLNTRLHGNQLAVPIRHYHPKNTTDN